MMMAYAKSLFFFLLLSGLAHGPIIGQNLRTIDSLKNEIHFQKPEQHPELYTSIAKIFKQTFQMADSFEIYLQKAIESGIKYNDHAAASEAYRLLGDDAGKRNEKTKAENYFEQGINLSIKNRDTVSLANLYYSRGLFYHRQAMHDYFIEDILKSIEYFEATENWDYKAKSLINLGVQYAGLKEIDLAIEKLLEAQKLEAYLSQPVRLYLMLHLGKNYRRKALGNSQAELLLESLAILEKGTKLADSIQSLSQMGDFRLALHDTYTVLDPPVYNEKLAQEVIDIGNKINDQFLIYQGNLAKAQMLVSQKKYRKAHNLRSPMEKALENLNNPVYHRSFYEVNYNISKNLNNNSEALYYLENFKLLNDSILNTERATRFNEINEKYESEKKQNEILLLSDEKETLVIKNELTQSKLRNRNLGIILLGVLSLSSIFFIYNKQSQRRIRAENHSLQIKQQLHRAQMNPHFIFNSLNGIKRFYVEGKTDLANDFLADFSKLLRKILDRSDVTSIPIAEEVEFLSLYLELEKRRLQDKLNYHIKFDEEEFDYDDYVPSFIIQPLVENAIWHGLLPSKSSGIIQVEISKKGDDIYIIVEDNGVGYKPHSSERNQKHRSKGINLIHDRLGSSGKLEIINLKEKQMRGTQAILTIKSNPI